MIVKPNEVGALGIVPKGLQIRLEKLENRGKIETTPATALRLTGILSLRLQWKPKEWNNNKAIIYKQSSKLVFMFYSSYIYIYIYIR